MAAATGMGLVGDLGDFDIDDLDVIQAAFDLDLSSSADDEFRGAACHYSAIFSDADIVSHCRHGCEDEGEGEGDGGAAAACAWLLAGLGDDDDGCGHGAEEEEVGSSSPADSGVTDDGPLAMAAGDDAEAMSAYVAELERFLLEDDGDDDELAEVDQVLLGVVDDYFAGDQLLATAEVVPAEEEEENGDGGDDFLAAREDEQLASRKRARYENEFL